MFRTAWGVPQGDVLSPRFVTLYLDEALRKINSLRIIGDFRQLPLHCHDYAVIDPPNLALYPEYADDFGFLCQKDENHQKMNHHHEKMIIMKIIYVKKVKNVLCIYSLIVNESNTEDCVNSSVKLNVKNLGILLNGTAEINKLKQLAGFASQK